MSKRFRDTEIWKKSFYKKLTPTYKLFWNFITDDCDHSGIWEVEDQQIISLRIGESVDLDTALHAFNEGEERIHVFDSGRKWFIIPFVSFQYGDLNANNRLHEVVRRSLESKDLLAWIPVRGPLGGPLNTPKDKEKDKEKDKDKVILEKECEKKPFGEEGLVLLTLAEHEKLLVKLGERKTAEFVIRLENYIGSKGKKYKSHYHTILSWSQNDRNTGDHDGLTKAQRATLRGLEDLNENRNPKQSDHATRGLISGDHV